ncbi:MAG: Bacteriocin-protection, YdeI or OmpD-Associated, partial [Frankiaceae bacterium]|nr:Bacteriocin-protection, YdeI or OmpD-Associated [Frankiaceae bacterium]
AMFDGLAFTHRKEYAVWVASAKQESTRERRAAKAVEMLRAGRRLP